MVGKVQYEVTLQNNDILAPNQGNKIILPGLQMKSTAEKLMKKGKTVECFTGLYFKHGDKIFISKAGEEFSYTSKDYASKGVTTANHGGAAIHLASVLKGVQQSIIDGKMKLRLTLQLRVYANLGTGISESTLANHYALGWIGMDITNKDVMKRTIDMPSANSPKIGDDITQWYPGDGTQYI